MLKNTLTTIRDYTESLGELEIISRSQSFFQNRTSNKIAKIFTPLETAVQEIEARRHNAELHARVVEYLGYDIPTHFNRSTPIFYLSRYLTTPNNEAIHVAQLTSSYSYPLVIGQDIRGKFTSNNELKRALGKLPVLKGYSHNEDEIIEYFTIVDFQAYDGKPMHEVQTVFGEPLVEFHNNMFADQFSHLTVESYDESGWVDRHFRNDIYKQYKHMLALLCVHGIMLESYPPDEHEFASNIVLPAFQEVTKELGCRPLIVEHIPQKLEVTKDWNSYPSSVYAYIKQKLTNCA